MQKQKVVSAYFTSKADTAFLLSDQYSDTTRVEYDGDCPTQKLKCTTYLLCKELL